MPKRLKIPIYAKLEIREALRIIKKSKRKLPIFSNLSKAKQLARNKYLFEKEARRIMAVYLRLRKYKLFKTDIIIKLNGGRKFGKHLVQLYKRGKRK